MRANPISCVVPRGGACLLMDQANLVGKSARMHEVRQLNVYIAVSDFNVASVLNCDGCLAN